MDKEPKEEILPSEPTEIIRSELLPEVQFDVGQLSDDVTWLQSDHMRRAMKNLIDLTAGWDGPYSKAIDKLALAKLLDTLTTLGMPVELSANLVPHSSGGLQAEWHHGEQGLEIVVNTDGSIDALAWPAKEGSYSIEIENVSSFSEPAIQALRKILSHLYELFSREPQ